MAIFSTILKLQPTSLINILRKISYSYFSLNTIILNFFRLNTFKKKLAKESPKGS